MKREPGNGGRFAPLLGGGLLVLCCGVPLLLAGGALSAVGTWFLDGAWLWLAAVPILLASGVHLWRRAESKKPREPEDSISATKATPSARNQGQ